jgi:predicted signal transduction protein with EAL and GGDEF domain
VASLEEVTRRCFAWRNVMAEVLHESAAELFLATHDPLTGLPNRTLILDRVEQMLARSRRSQTPVAALFVDLDNFKSINDTLGHGIGDELLGAVAARLDGAIRDADAAYQPTIDLNDMSPTGVEALIRWKHPVRGVVQPDDFVPLLEETGLITEVGKWVLEEACSQVAAWRAAGYPIGMAVNVSGRQLDTDQLIVDIEGALSHSELDPGALTIEITETTLMRNVDETARRLAQIKALGVRIAIDDFGTGYSSLAHLQRFPVDALKIDRSFIAGMRHNQEGETLIHTLVQLGKALSIETFAEGIEQQAELSLLRGEDCDSGQGFLFARPLDVAATEAFLRDWAENATPALAQAPQHS